MSAWKLSRLAGLVLAVGLLAGAAGLVSVSEVSDIAGSAFMLDATWD